MSQALERGSITMRRSYEARFEALSQAFTIIGEPRHQVSRCPRHDDEEPGPGLLRTKGEGLRLENLTLPGLFMAHTELRCVSFAGSDLHLSTFNWSHFVECHFTACDLRGADLRSCRFSSCSFREADLSGADLRSSRFDGSDFAGAAVTDMVLLRQPRLLWRVARLWSLPWAPGPRISLSKRQRALVSWSDEVEEPGKDDGP